MSVPETPLVSLYFLRFLTWLHVRHGIEQDRSKHILIKNQTTTNSSQKKKTSLARPLPHGQQSVHPAARESDISIVVPWIPATAVVVAQPAQEDRKIMKHEETWGSDKLDEPDYLRHDRADCRRSKPWKKNIESTLLGKLGGCTGRGRQSVSGFAPESRDSVQRQMPMNVMGHCLAVCSLWTIWLHVLNNAESVWSVAHGHTFYVESFPLRCQHPSLWFECRTQNDRLSTWMNYALQRLSFGWFHWCTKIKPASAKCGGAQETRKERLLDMIRDMDSDLLLGAATFSTKDPTPDVLFGFFWLSTAKGSTMFSRTVLDSSWFFISSLFFPQ